MIKTQNNTFCQCFPLIYHFCFCFWKFLKLYLISVLLWGFTFICLSVCLSVHLWVCLSGCLSAHNIDLKILIVQQLLSPNSTWLSYLQIQPSHQPPAHPKKLTAGVFWLPRASGFDWYNIVILQCWVSLKTEKPPPSWLAIGTKIRL